MFKKPCFVTFIQDGNGDISFNEFVWLMTKWVPKRIVGTKELIKSFSFSSGNSKIRILRRRYASLPKMSSSVFDFLQLEMQMVIETDRKHKLRGCHVMKQVREAFRVFDKEGNGFITNTDLMEVK